MNKKYINGKVLGQMDRMNKKKLPKEYWIWILFKGAKETNISKEIFLFVNINIFEIRYRHMKRLD